MPSLIEIARSAMKDVPEPYRVVLARWEEEHPRPERDECPHALKECRYIVNCQGRKMYRMQCLLCGRPTGNFMKHVDVPRDRPVKPWDHDLENDQGAIQRERNQARWVEWREVRSKLFWSYYDDYILSRQWRNRRTPIMQRANGICECCRARQAEDVHHRTYTRLGEEEDDDLVALCRNCHRFLHPHRIPTN